MARNEIPSHKTVENAKWKKGDPATGLRLRDGDGLWLLVKPNQSKHWRFTYTKPDGSGKENILSFGQFPEVGLDAARGRAQAARNLLAERVDPKAHAEKQEQAARAEAVVADEVKRTGVVPGSFKALALAFYDANTNPKNAKQWSAVYAKKWKYRVEGIAFPVIGDKLLPDITKADIRTIIDSLHRHGTLDTARRVVGHISQVFEYGIAIDACAANPARALLRNDAVVIKPEVTHMPSVTNPAQIGVLMKGIFEYAVKKVGTGTALVLIAHTFQRPFNIRSAKWEDFDLDGGKWAEDFEVGDGPVWRIPAMEMKRRKAGKVKGKPHFVPLARQVVVALRRLHGATGHGEYLFPGLKHSKSPYMSDGTINKALRLMGCEKGEMVGHGFRSMARTVIGNKLSIAADVVEAQLAHAKSGPLGDAYDRAEFLEKRADMMQQWADYLESLRLNPPLKLAA